MAEPGKTTLLDTHLVTYSLVRRMIDTGGGIAETPVKPYFMRPVGDVCTAPRVVPGADPLGRPGSSSGEQGGTRIGTRAYRQGRYEHPLNGLLSECGPEGVSFGRNPTSDILVFKRDDPYRDLLVSKVHGRVVWDGSSILYRDTSTNGTCFDPTAFGMAEGSAVNVTGKGDEVVLVPGAFGKYDDYEVDINFGRHLLPPPEGRVGDTIGIESIPTLHFGLRLCLRKRSEAGGPGPRP